MDVEIVRQKIQDAVGNQYDSWLKAKEFGNKNLKGHMQLLAFKVYDICFSAASAEVKDLFNRINET